MRKWTRREFIQVAGGAAGGAALVAGGCFQGSAPRRVLGLDPGTDGDRIVRSFCEICFWKCGIEVHVKGGRATKIAPIEKHPLSNGMLCPRGLGGTGLLYDPDRLKRPLVREGGRGGQRFREASWEEALDRAAEGMERVGKEHGPEAMGLFHHGTGEGFFKRLLGAYGSPNAAAPSYAQCRGPRDEAWVLTYGHPVGSPEPVDMARADCIVLIGCHLGENMHNTAVQEFADAVARGATVITVDPRFSIAAGKSRHWLPIRPGTDLALLLAWIHVIIEEDLYDREFVEKDAAGLDKLREAVKDRTPVWAYPITGIRPDRIAAAAREMAQSRPRSLVHPGRHVTWYGDDTQRLRAIAILNALLGNYGRRGGLFVPSKPEIASPAWPEIGEHGPSVSAGYPLAGEGVTTAIVDATLTGKPYPIKGWFVYGTNLPLSFPNAKRLAGAIQKLELLVAVDTMPMEITGWADVVLPECTYLERFDDLYACAWKEPFVALRQPAVEPLGDSRPGWWIARKLARRLGLGRYLPIDDIQAYLRQRAELSGLDFEELAREGFQKVKGPPAFVEDGLLPVFDTPSGKVELWSGTLEAAGLDPVPVYTPHPQPAPGMLRLLFGRVPVHTFGRTTNSPVLSEIVGENQVWVHVSVARRLGLERGHMVRIVGEDGKRSTPVKLRATEAIRADCCYLPHGFGHSDPRLRRAHGRGASDSDLITRFEVDPLMGGTGMNVNFVSIEPAEA